tara:strand:+ start:383 stop:634 length:252 start_codon:yes stop_codon:yes gene_type:complete
MEVFTPLTYVDEDPDGDGRFLRVIYRRDPHNPHLPDLDNGYVTSIEMITDKTNGERVDYENVEYRLEDYVEILMGLLNGEYHD